MRSVTQRPLLLLGDTPEKLCPCPAVYLTTSFRNRDSTTVRPTSCCIFKSDRENGRVLCEVGVAYTVDVELCDHNKQASTTNSMPLTQSRTFCANYTSTPPYYYVSTSTLSGEFIFSWSLAYLWSRLNYSEYRTENSKVGKEKSGRWRWINTVSLFNIEYWTPIRGKKYKGKEKFCKNFIYFIIF